MKIAKYITISLLALTCLGFTACGKSSTAKVSENDIHAANVRAIDLKHDASIKAVKNGDKDLIDHINTIHEIALTNENARHDNASERIAETERINSRQESTAKAQLKSDQAMNTAANEQARGAAGPQQVTTSTTQTSTHTTTPAAAPQQAPPAPATVPATNANGTALPKDQG